MLFRTSVYKTIGGYEGATQNINDDVQLGRNLIQAGYRWLFLDGNGTVTCRMYHNFSEAVEGFSKNVFGFFNYRILPYIFIWSAVAFLFLEPLRLSVLAVQAGWQDTLPAKLAVLIVFESLSLFLLAYHRLGIPVYMAFFYWLTIFLFVIVAMNIFFINRSILLKILGKAIGGRLIPRATLR